MAAGPGVHYLSVSEYMELISDAIILYYIHRLAVIYE